jgi:hypothetical protein
MGNESTATTEEVVKKDKGIIYGSFLKDEIVAVKPVPSSGKWSNLLVSGQDKKSDPFIYNKVKRSYQVPLKNYREGGGVTPILDDQTRVNIKKYMTSFPDGMTQKEFFEKELGVDLNNTLAAEENFWRTDKRGRVTITRKGLNLNLNQPLDMLKYLILLSNKMLISPSFDDARKKATYEFMLVDEGKLKSKKVQEGKRKANAYTEFARLTSSEDKMIGFIKSLGRVLPANYTTDWLEDEILTVLENSHENFLAIVKDPQYDAKIFIQQAVDAGAILKKGDKRYTLDNGIELGDLLDTINYVNDPSNQEVKFRIKGKIQLASKK